MYLLYNSIFETIPLAVGTSFDDIVALAKYLRLNRIFVRYPEDCFPLTIFESDTDYPVIKIQNY